ncbi:hypothetical protein CHL76_08300 [Marinococcus halophilus]|uniref:Uncharacterized protein n=1 Tax=Marinococcus halophilus TaxID=1371 RepID=A0A510Y9U2_MARHA|nr:hypothetical protein [Marinococcus halophilus]OZT80515.1 hypothetical protein CHL76_08300 [Marinococcus halophilus]GEK60156.1 hypothetical protein MHA01_30610 [Marinococcus halophilus]
MEITSILPVVGTAIGFMLVALSIVLLIAVKGKIVGVIMTAGLLMGGSGMYYLIQQDASASLEEKPEAETAELRQKRSEQETIKTAAVESAALNKSEMAKAYEKEIIQAMEYISVQLSSTMEALAGLNQNNNPEYWRRANEELLSLDAALNKAQKLLYEPQGYEQFQPSYQYTLTELLDYSDQLSFAAEEYYYGLDAELLEYYVVNNVFPENVTEAFDMMEAEGEEAFRYEKWNEEMERLFPGK